MSAAGPRVGILALQGAFDAHRRALEDLGAHATLVRTEAELAACDGLVLPGGESTTMLKLLNDEHLKEPLADFARHKPVFATCAGVILLAREVTHPVQESLNILDLTVERNGYGRQIDSCISTLDLNGEPLEAVFIPRPHHSFHRSFRKNTSHHGRSPRARRTRPASGGHVPPRAHAEPRRPPALPQ